MAVSMDSVDGWSVQVNPDGGYSLSAHDVTLQAQDLFAILESLRERYPNADISVIINVDDL